MELVEERRKGNVTERLLQASAASYVISPSALAAVAPDPARAPDRLSARWLLALAAQLVRDVGDLITGATRAQRKLATFAMDGTVRFASASDRAAFTAELMQAVTSLVAKYHDERAEGGREHHLVVAVHPSLTARPDASTAAGRTRAPLAGREHRCRAGHRGQGGGFLMGHQFAQHHEAEVPASPDEVWAAIATGPGIDSWFMGRNEVTAGAVRTVFGEYTPELEITEADPAHRFAYRSGQAPDGRFIAYEFLIEGRAGGSTVLRTVTSGFLPGEDWADEFEAMTLGGELYFRTLVEYLTYFAGRFAAPVTAFGPSGPPGPRPDRAGPGTGRCSAASSGWPRHPSPATRCGSPVRSGRRTAWSTSPTRMRSACAPRMRCTGSCAASASR